MVIFRTANFDDEYDKPKNAKNLAKKYSFFNIIENSLTWDRLKWLVEYSKLPVSTMEGIKIKIEKFVKIYEVKKYRKNVL